MCRNTVIAVMAILTMVLGVFTTTAHAATGWRYPAPSNVAVDYLRANGYQVRWSGVTGPSGQKPNTYTFQTYQGGKLIDQFTTSHTYANEYGRGGHGLAVGRYVSRVWANGSPLAPLGTNTVAAIYGLQSASGYNGGLPLGNDAYDIPGEISSSDGNNGTVIINNMWNCDPDHIKTNPTPDSCGQQTLNGYNPSYFDVTSNQLKNNKAVMTYPDIQTLLTGSSGNNPNLSSFNKIVSTYDEYMPPSNENYDAEFAYDLWLDSTGGRADEIMIWLDNHGQTPSGDFVKDVTFYGQKFHVYYDKNATVNFVLDHNQTKGTVHILAMLQWLVANGYENSNVRVAQLDSGWEICGTNSQPMRFGMRGYTMLTNPPNGNQD